MMDFNIKDGILKVDDNGKIIVSQNIADEIILNDKDNKNLEDKIKIIK